LVPIVVSPTSSNKTNQLGEGAFSVVKEGTHKQTSRTFAIKIVTKAKLTKEDELALKDEIDVLKELRHKHIIRLYDVFDEPQYYFLVTEQMKGGELFDRVVAKQYYNEKEARDVCKILFEALAYCHGKKIAHRDLKPENLLLQSPNNDRDLKIADFGFAKRCPSVNCLTTQCGTPGYVAPEILEGVPYGTQSDMWSLGVIAYILLGGYPPFIENNQRELFRKIRRGSFEFHEEYWGSVSKDAKKLISSLLTVDPTKRLTAKQALRNKWITGSDEKLAGKDLGKNLEEFKKFNAKRKFKAAVKGVIAANMMKTFVGGAKATSLERKLTDEDIGDLKETFQMFDKDGGGTISMAELKGVMERLGTKVSDAELKEIIATVDENNDGEIDMVRETDGEHTHILQRLLSNFLYLLFVGHPQEEFISMMKKMPEKKDELREAFKTFDADGDGCTTRSELRRVMIKFGQHLTDPELDAVMLEVDKNRGECPQRHKLHALDLSGKKFDSSYLTLYFFSHSSY